MSLSLPAAALLALLGCQGDEPATDRAPVPQPTGATADTAAAASVCDVATWEVAAEPVLRTWCTACHSSALEGVARSGAPAGMDFDTWELASPFAQLIRDAAVPDDARMPPEGMASPEEREWLAHWVDCGALGSADEVRPCAEERTAPADSTDPCATGHNHVAGTLEPPPGADLSCLCAVDGDLVAADRTTLELTQLQRLGGDLDVSGSDLTEVSAPALTFVGGDLRLVGHAGLQRLVLPDLVEVAGSIHVSDGYAGGRLELEQLTDVGGDLVVQALPTAEEIWLPRVESVGGDYRVADHPELHDLPFFFELESVGGELTVRGNPRLTELVLASQLLSVGGLEVGGNGLVQLSLPYYDLTTVPGDVHVHDEPSLTSLVGLSSVASVGGTVRLEGLPALTTVTILPVAASLGGLSIVGIGNLEEPVPTLVTAIEGDVRIADAPGLVVLPFVASLGHIEGGLELKGLAGLPSVAELGALTTVGGNLVLDDLDTLTDLSPLHGVQQVAGDLVIQGNAGLTPSQINDLIDAIDTLGGSVIADDNG